MRFLGFVFVTLIFSFLIVWADTFLPGNFLSDFINNHFIETFAALIGFNLASVTFLLGQLITIEATINKDSLFDTTRTEIKHNAYFLLGGFIVSMLLLIGRPDFNSTGNIITSNITYHIIHILVLTIFLMSLFAIFEILSSVFSVGKFFKKN